MNDTEGERVGVEFKKILKEIQTERIRRGTDKDVKSRKRICKGIAKLYEINENFKDILLNSNMPTEDKND